MKIDIRGHHLPGRMFRHAGVPVHNVHVGVQVRAAPEELVAADADGAHWRLDVRIVADDHGDLDFAGPAVHGSRGKRFLYLTWGDLGPDNSFAMFRRAKLMLGDIDARLLGDAMESDRVLVATIDLTDACGGPICGRVGPPALAWSLGS